MTSKFFPSLSIAASAWMAFERSMAIRTNGGFPSFLEVQRKAVISAFCAIDGNVHAASKKKTKVNKSFDICFITFLSIYKIRIQMSDKQVCIILIAKIFDVSI